MQQNQFNLRFTRSEIFNEIKNGILFTIAKHHQRSIMKHLVNSGQVHLMVAEMVIIYGRLWSEFVAYGLREISTLSFVHFSF